MPEQEAACAPAIYEFSFFSRKFKIFPVCHKMSPATVMIDKYMAAFFAGQMRSL
jgi:hypothetical protein